MTSTHDLPTVAGWWHGTDIATRAVCGARADVNAADDGERAQRPYRPVAGVRARRVAAGGAPPPQRRTRAVDAALAFWRVHAPLCLLPIEDLLGRKSSRTCRARSTSIRTGGGG